MTGYSNIPDVLTVSELQKTLRIGRSTAYHLIKSKEIRSVRIGKNIRIPKKFVIEFLNDHCVSSNLGIETQDVISGQNRDTLC